MSYCPGENCSIRDKCQRHYDSGQVIDWSNYGSCSAGIDKNGKSSYHCTICCGDNGTNGYEYFKPLGKHQLSYKHEYNDTGTKLKLAFELEFPYDAYTVFEFPASCSSCPVGFMNAGDCGRNTPFTGEDYKQRPSTCKLKRISPSEIQQKLTSAYNMIETVPPVEE